MTQISAEICAKNESINAFGNNNTVYVNLGENVQIELNSQDAFNMIYQLAEVLKMPIEQLEQIADDLEDERDTLRAERDELQEENDSLREYIQDIRRGRNVG